MPGLALLKALTPAVFEPDVSLPVQNEMLPLAPSIDAGSMTLAPVIFCSSVAPPPPALSELSSPQPANRAAAQVSAAAKWVPLSFSMRPGLPRRAELFDRLASSRCTAGPWRTSPSGLKREPWHGQSQLRSAVFQLTWQPRWVQIGETATSVPSSRRWPATFSPAWRTMSPSPGARSSIGRVPRCLIAVADHVQPDPRVLLDEASRGGARLEAVGVEQRRPRVLAPLQQSLSRSAAAVPPVMPHFAKPVAISSLSVSGVILPT